MTRGASDRNAHASIAPAPIDPDWIAVDWGTSTLRAWAIGAGGSVLAEARSEAGMGGLGRDDFEPALLALVGGWLGTGRCDVVACGMVGARQGWREAPYREVPCPPLDAGRAVLVPTRDPRLAVHLLPGLAQTSPADVMRGEETQIAGLLAAEPGFDGVACLPGTHTKWVHVTDGTVVSFASFMTGEIFALLAHQSVLRHALDGPEEEWDEAAFVAAVEESLAHPQRLAARLFGIRAEGLLAGLAPARARARLSGLLIGAEIAAARPYWLGRDLVLIGAPGLAGRYAAALASLGAAARLRDASALTRTGLAAARAALKED